VDALTQLGRGISATMETMRRALVSFVVLLAACESQSSSGFSSAGRAPFCSDGQPCNDGDFLPPKGIPPNGGIVIENDSEVELKVASFLLSLPTIDARVVDGTLDMAIPASVLPAPTTRFVPPHGVHSISNPIFVVDPVKGAVGPDVGAIFEVGGVTALYVGKGTLRTRRVDAVLQLVPIDSTKIRIVRVSKEVPTCKGETRLAFNPAGADFQHVFKIGELTRSDGCTTVQLEPTASTDIKRQIRFCVAEEAWPFTAGDQVMLEQPLFLSPIDEGLRLQRADGTAFELVRIERDPKHVFATADLAVHEDVSCVLPNDPLAVCNVVGIRAAVVPSAIPLTNARAWVASATIPAFSVDCNPTKNPSLEIVARSEP